jgi:hypothetical protein
MAPAALDDAPLPPAVDVLPSSAERQSRRSLLFSDVVDLMAMIVSKGRPSIKVAYKSTQGPWELPGRLSATRSIGRDRTVSTSAGNLGIGRHRPQWTDQYGRAFVTVPLIFVLDLHRNARCPMIRLPTVEALRSRPAMASWSPASPTSRRPSPSVPPFESALACSRRRRGRSEGWT